MQANQTDAPVARCNAAAPASKSVGRDRNSVRVALPMRDGRWSQSMHTRRPASRARTSCLLLPRSRTNAPPARERLRKIPARTRQHPASSVMLGNREKSSEIALDQNKLFELTEITVSERRKKWQRSQSVAAL
eukprot:6180930-Pleurochrysis_carterae.AAC.5